MVVPSRSQWVLATTLLVTLETGRSFQIAPRVLPISPLRTSTRQHLTLDQYYLESSRKGDCFTNRNNLKGTRSWSAEEGGTNEPEDDSSQTNNEAYEGLYEFLTRRTGEQAGESERRRKRDRIREWMGASSSSSQSSSSGGSSLVRPIRMEDGSVVEEDPIQTQARLDKLFSGMPTLDEILSRDGARPTKADIQTKQKAPSVDSAAGKSSNLADDSWFDEERKQLKAEYEQIIEDMKEQIRKQRQEDPDSMPDNAEGVAQAVVKQELERILTTVKLARAKEHLEEYQINKMSELDSKDLTGAKDEVVERMLKEAAEDWKRKEALQAEVDEFLRYENEARANLASPSAPEPGADLDAWALERLENMLETTQQKASESGAAVTDIIEQQIEDLRERIEKDSRRGSIKPQTMKEWQMYRAIAKRLGRERGFDPKLDAALNLAKLDEEQVVQRLKSWKEYIGKEEEVREKAGLSVGIKMPFDWQRASKTSDNTRLSPATGEVGSVTLSRREMRRDVNMKALQAFEELIQKSDPSRAESLKKQLDALRAQLEPLDYVDVEEDITEQTPAGPVDLSSVFGDRGTSGKNSRLPSSLYDEQKSAIDRVLASDAESIYQSDEQFITPHPPPQTQLSSDFEEYQKKPPPPRTPFFDESLDAEPGKIDVKNSKLGTADDQKLLNMYRRAGARTKEEQDSIREQWESFQALEKAKRDASGLSDDEASLRFEEVIPKYDMSDLMTSDGDFDAEKVLSRIGPRPARKKKVVDGSSPTLVEGTDQQGTKSELDPAQVSESVFRSVAAVGGGRIKEAPETRDEQKASFEAYLKKEDELRKSLDDLDEEAMKIAQNSDIAIDDPSYAQDVLASIGPRPALKKRVKEALDERDLSDRGGLAALDEEDDVDDEDEMGDVRSSSTGLVPDWLKKERKSMEKGDDYDASGRPFSGRNIDEVFDDSKYDHNLRQLHEYEQRRSGKQKHMGIDISDVLGSRTRSSDDYADYSFDTDYFQGRQRDWGATSFEARKANLLEYVELSIPELNNLMDHRESVYATGVSQYLPRINKPFKEFGAIFRLEGVLLDLNGLHDKTWRKVATEFKFKAPTEEEVRRASVVRPEVAIREVFFWSNDVFVVREAIASFRRVFNEIFDEWAAENNLSLDVRDSKPEQNTMILGAEAMSDDSTASTSPSEAASRLGEQSKLKRMQEAWTRTAQELELSVPTNEQIALSTFLSPEIAVREVFRWTTDRQDIDAVVSVYRAILNGDVNSGRMVAPNAKVKNGTSESSLLEAQYQAWAKIAEGGSFAPPTPEEVLAAAVLNDPEVVILNGFGWTSNPMEARGLAERYREYLSEFLGQPQPPKPVSPEPLGAKAEEAPQRFSGPTAEEVLKTQIEAWSETAATHNFTPPKPDQLQLTMSLSPGDSVRRLLGWTYNFNEEQIGEITESYERALQKASEKYVKAYNLEVKPPEAPAAAPDKKSKELTGDDLFKAAFDAWTNVAWQSGFSLPSQEQVQFAMAVGPEEAIVSGFGWAKNYVNATDIAIKYRNQIRLKREEWAKEGYNLSSNNEVSSSAEVKTSKVSVVPGVADWIKSLIQVEMACGVTSYLEEHQVDLLLQYSGLSDLFPQNKRVCETNGYERDSQQMLGVALRIERRPDHCVVFDSSPGANGAAHEVEMRSVAMVGPYPRYELLSADASAFSFDELTAMNIRRLFGERVYDQPMLDMMQNQPEVTRKTKTKFWDDE